MSSPILCSALVFLAGSHLVAQDAEPPLTADAIAQLKAQIAAQQKQIDQLRQTLQAQQKLLDRATPGAAVSAC